MPGILSPEPVKADTGPKAAGCPDAGACRAPEEGLKTAPLAAEGSLSPATTRTPSPLDLNGKDNASDSGKVWRELATYLAVAT